MSYKKWIKARHVPVKYRRFKGCFGPAFGQRQKQDCLIKFPERISLTPDEIAMEVVGKLDESVRNPFKKADFRKVTEITIRGGILLRAYFDEFFAKNGFLPTIKPPKNVKMKAVIQFLGLGEYGLDYSNYPDITCWDIRCWDADDDFKNVNYPKQIVEEIIPKCCGKGRKLDKISKNLASAVAEAINNSSEHAYKGEKERSQFRKWYLGCGEYPGSGALTFCVYDKGQGFKESMKHEGLMWNLIQSLNSDYEYIKRATEGTSGTKADGRGKGLKTAVSKLKNFGGWVEILSSKGFFSSTEEKDSKDRKTFIDGSIIAFYVPVKYIEREK